MRRLLLALLVALPCIAVASSARGLVEANQPLYYLALGDSYAHGYQPNGDTTHGYPYYLELQLQYSMSNLQLVDYGCTGETSATMLGSNGQLCPNAATVTGPGWNPSTAQLAQAVSFLKAHAGSIRLITIDIGGNDLSALKTVSDTQLISTFVTLIQQVRANLDSAYGQLRSAAGTTPIFTMTYPDPEVVNPLVGSIVDSYYQQFNNAIISEAQKYNITVAPVYQAFNQVPNPNAVICAFTWFCSTSPRDVHPNAAGYGLIADQFWHAGVNNV